MCHGCVYTGGFELDYPRSLLAALHVHRMEIPYRAFPGSLESVDYFGATDHFSGRKKKKKKKNNLKVTRPSFFGGVPSYFEGLRNPHLYFYRKSNI